MGNVASGLLDIAGQIGTSDTQKALKDQQRYLDIRITPAQMAALRPYVAVALKKANPNLADAERQADLILSTATQRSLPEIKLMISSGLALEKASRQGPRWKPDKKLDKAELATKAYALARKALSLEGEAGNKKLNENPDLRLQLGIKATDIAGANWPNEFPHAPKVLQRLGKHQAEVGVATVPLLADKLAKTAYTAAGGRDKFRVEDPLASDIMESIAQVKPETVTGLKRVLSPSKWINPTTPIKPMPLPGTGLVDSAPVSK